MERSVRHHVLVSEDDAELRGALCAVLDSEGCPNSEADCGKAALALIEEGLQPCLVPLNVRVPGISASDFLERLREFPGGPSMPVVLITGSDPPPLPAVDGLLRKPFDGNAGARGGKALRLQHRQEENRRRPSPAFFSLPDRARS